MKNAVEKGYVLDKIFEAWHFERISKYDPQTKSGRAFTDYANTFLKMKQEASDWPKWCQTDDDRYRYSFWGKFGKKKYAKNNVHNRSLMPSREHSINRNCKK